MDTRVSVSIPVFILFTVKLTITCLDWEVISFLISFDRNRTWFFFRQRNRFFSWNVPLVDMNSYPKMCFPQISNSKIALSGYPNFSYGLNSRDDWTVKPWLATSLGEENSKCKICFWSPDEELARYLLKTWVQLIAACICVFLDLHRIRIKKKKLITGLSVVILFMKEITNCHFS